MPSELEIADPQAGWYEDPDSSGKLRFWDGTVWTDRFRDAPPVAQRARRVPTRMRVLVGVIALAIVLIAVLLSRRGSSGPGAGATATTTPRSVPDICNEPEARPYATDL